MATAADCVQCKKGMERTAALKGLLTSENANHFGGRKAALDLTKSLKIFQLQVLRHVQHEGVVGQSGHGDFHCAFLLFYDKNFEFTTRFNEFCSQI